MALKRFKEYDMYESAKNALRRRYPASDGWEIFERDNRKTGYIPDFVIERPRVKGIFIDTPMKKAIAEVKAEKIITEQHARQLTEYVRNHAGGKQEIVGRHLIVPAGADISKIESLIAKFNIEVIRLNSFKR